MHAYEIPGTQITTVTAVANIKLTFTTEMFLSLITVVSWLVAQSKMRRHFWLKRAPGLREMTLSMYLEKRSAVIEPPFATSTIISKIEEKKLGIQPTALIIIEISCAIMQATFRP